MTTPKTTDDIITARPITDQDQSRTGTSPKRGIILTDRMCERRVVKRVKIYDRKCSGLYISIIPAGVATFAFMFTDRATGKQRSAMLGV